VPVPITIVIVFVGIPLGPLLAPLAADSATRVGHTADDARHVNHSDSVGRSAKGGGGIGILDAPSFLAALLEWVVARAFDAIEELLEGTDLRVLRGPFFQPERRHP
jgi:hypothetical protein